MAKRYELSDEAWDVVSDLFIETHGRGRPRLNDRLMLDGVLWVLCSSAAWRDMPERFVHGQRSISGSGVGETRACSIRCSNACI